MHTITLRYFLKLVELKNFSLAAEELCVTQPTISQHISRLERDLNVKLIARTTRNFGLTEAGKAFLSYAEKIVDIEDQMRSNISNYSTDKKKTLKVGVIPTIGKLNQTENILSFGKLQKDLNIELYENYSENLYKLMVKGKLDVAIANRMEKTASTSILNSIPFMLGRTVVVCSESHRFASLRSITLEEAVEEPIINLNRKSSIFNEMAQQFKKHRLTPRYISESTSTANMISLVDAGYGISFLSDIIAVNYATKKTKIIKISPKLLHMTVILVRKEDAEREVIRDFIRYMSQYANLLEPDQKLPHNAKLNFTS